jgi:hypothetical protein
MLNRTLLALTLSAAFGAAALAPNAAYAWTAPAGHRAVFPARTTVPVVHPVIPVHPIVPVHPVFPGHPGFHHWVFRDGRWIVLEAGVVAEAPVPAPGPCTCLTKSYTNDGQVLFADICTKESASAPINGNTDAATPLPQN